MLGSRHALTVGVGEAPKQRDFTMCPRTELFAPYMPPSRLRPSPNKLILLVPQEGIEPPTHALRMRCSTPELLRQKAY